MKFSYNVLNQQKTISLRQKDFDDMDPELF